MNILVIGNGPVEQAICGKLHQSEAVQDLFSTPQHPGISRFSRAFNVCSHETADLAELAQKFSIDLTIVGPDASDNTRIVKHFRDKGLRIFGPGRETSPIQQSTAFFRNHLQKLGVPMPSFQLFSTSSRAINALERWSYPLVIKQIEQGNKESTRICTSEREAEETLRSLSDPSGTNRTFEQIVFEEFTEGWPCSLSAICGQQDLMILPYVRPYRHLEEGETGPLVEGMGAVSPVPSLGEQQQQKIIEQMLLPALHMVHELDPQFCGLLRIELKMTHSGPKLIDVQLQFDDPASLPLFQLMEKDIVPYLKEATEGNLADTEPMKWRSGAGVSIDLVSQGYPDEFDTGYEITGELETTDQVMVLQNQTRKESGRIYTDGGRVLSVSGRGADVQEARKHVLDTIDRIQFRGMHYRSDIAREFVDSSSP